MELKILKKDKECNELPNWPSKNWLGANFSAIAEQYSQTGDILGNPDQNKINALENQRLESTTAGNGYIKMCQSDGVISRPFLW